MSDKREITDGELDGLIKGAFELDKVMNGGVLDEGELVRAKMAAGCYPDAQMRYALVILSRKYGELVRDALAQARKEI